METTIKKWGNSLAFRLPKSFASQAGVKDGSVVDISIDDEKIVIKPIKEDVDNLDVLLDRVTPCNKHSEIDTDESIGNEVC